jgi:glycosyltransferase involved in cell wall biosynthesis
MRIVIDITRLQDSEPAIEAAVASVSRIIERQGEHEVMVAINSRNTQLRNRLRTAPGCGLPLQRIRQYRVPVELDGDQAFAAIESLLHEGFISGLGGDYLVTVDAAGSEHLVSLQLSRSTAPAVRLRLAMITPLPPEQTGVADYSAVLIQKLSQWYDIDVVTNQESVVAMGMGRVLDYASFYKCASSYDRVVYHIGNSRFHLPMFDALKRFPGIVVLHDYFLGDVFFSLQSVGGDPHALHRAAYQSGGYASLLASYKSRDYHGLMSSLPVNFQLFRDSIGVIVHNEYCRALAQSHYGSDAAAAIRRIPLLRPSPVPSPDQADARRRLGLPQSGFILCAFGVLGQSKLNRELIEAWLISNVWKHSESRLIFVGENSGGSYGEEIERLVGDALYSKVSVTGWVAPEIYNLYLAAADAAVQLRGVSRGESSASLLDCLIGGLPTIANERETLAEIPSDALYLVSNRFTSSELSRMIDDIAGTPEFASQVGLRGRHFALATHSAEHCAASFAYTIEEFYGGARGSPLQERGIVSSLAAVLGTRRREAELVALAEVIAEAMPRRTAGRQIIVDVTSICQEDLRTGIQRVVRALVIALLKEAPQGVRIEPAFISYTGGKAHFRYARCWTSDLLQIPSEGLLEEPVTFGAGDILFGADFTGPIVVAAERDGLIASMRAMSVEICFVIYDLLPLQMPAMFPPGGFSFAEWFNSIVRVADQVFCISDAAKRDLERQLADLPITRDVPLHINTFPLGSDFENSRPSKGLAADAHRILAAIATRPSFLMVGTIEPRKAYTEVLDAFEILWRGEHDVNLVIVGREGWKGLPPLSRRAVSDIVQRLSSDPQRGLRLWWLDDASDEFLDRLYTSTECLLAASYGEGFGLPLVEGARRGIPILARDIPVFREVAGGYANFFDSTGPVELADALSTWLKAHSTGVAPVSRGVNTFSWSDGAKAILKTLLSPRNAQTMNP